MTFLSFFSLQNISILSFLSVDHFFSQYSLAGDDSVTEAVTDLARGTLCPALKAIFQHGLKKPSILGGPCHPWLFIEEVGKHCYCTVFNQIPTGLY